LTSEAKTLTGGCSAGGTGAQTVQILLVDDHVATREEMRALIVSKGDMEVIGESGSGEDAIEQARRLRPDVIVMDIFLPGMSGVEATRRILQENPLIKVVALSNYSGYHLVRAVRDAGGVGQVRKDHAFEELIPAIRSVCAGKPYLGANVQD